MYIDGELLAVGEKMRLDPGLFGVRIYKPEKCYNGFVLFSPYWDDTEYLIHMRGVEACLKRLDTDCLDICYL